jgi:hypothetical protein
MERNEKTKIRVSDLCVKCIAHPMGINTSKILIQLYSTMFLKHVVRDGVLELILFSGLRRAATHPFELSSGGASPPVRAGAVFRLGATLGCG